MGTEHTRPREEADNFVNSIRQDNNLDLNNFPNEVLYNK